MGLSFLLLKSSFILFLFIDVCVCVFCFIVLLCVTLQFFMIIQAFYLLITRASLLSLMVMLEPLKT